MIHKKHLKMKSYMTKIVDYLIIHMIY